MRAFLMGIVLALFSTAAFADNVLILGGEGDSYVSVQTELEAAGHTVTYDSGTVLPADISGYQQIWDMRYNTAISPNDIAIYDTFLKNNGYLYLSGEHAGFATRNNSISAFTNTLGGGTITVSGYAINQQDAVDGFFSADTTVEYAMAAIITIDEGGTARVLSTDSNGDPTGIMWIGNAGDLGEGYNGTVVVIADINWTQSNFVSGQNTIFLQELIGGIVAGTVGGTISESGNGDAADIGGEPAGPEITTGTGTRTYTVATAETQTATDNGVEQTLAVYSNSETCTQGTVTTLHDGVVQDELTVDSNDAATCLANDPVLEQTYTGKVDQLATAQDVVSTQIRNLSFDGVQGVRQNHDYANGMSGSTTGFTLGGELPITDNGLIIGGGLAQLNTSLNGDDSASASTMALQGSVGRAVGNGVATVKLTRATTDYSWSREIGPYSNAGTSTTTDTSVSGTYRYALNQNITPIVGYTVGRRETDAWQETGYSVTQRSAEASFEDYNYGTIGVEADFGLLNGSAIRHTDGVTVLGAGIGGETEKFDWGLGVERTITDLGESTGIQAGIKIRF